LKRSDKGEASLAIGSHAVFYVARTGRADVIRILHLRMDPARHL
jgi:plasmid stabilization system protein ParE